MILSATDPGPAPAPRLADSPAPEKRAAIAIAGLFFVVLLGGSAMIPLDSGAVATGTVIVSGRRQAVQHKEGGIVSRLLAREGQRVRKGDPLLVIAATDIAAGERGMTAEVLTLLAQRERLKAERDGLPAMAAPPEYLAMAPRERALADVALREQRRIFEAGRGSVAAQQDVLVQRRRQNREQVVGIDRQMVSNREQRRLLEDELRGMRALEKKGFAATNRIRALERDAAALDGDYGAYQARRSEVREATGEVSMQSVTLEREKVEQASSELRDVNVRLEELLPKLAAVREQLARAIVRAPASGRVVGLKTFTVGGVVGPGEVLMEIVPEDRALVIDAKVSPQDADDIVPGQAAEVRFPALQERNLPIIDGRITSLSADSFADERTGEHFFRAEVRVPDQQLRNVRALRQSGNAIQPGLAAEVVVPLRRRSALRYLLEPLTRSIWLAGRQD